MPRSTAKPPDDQPPAIYLPFTDKTLKFLRGLKKNNNKPWFEEHRGDYDAFLREPSKSLVESMAAIFREQRIPLIASAQRSLFRINRDIRFSNDKSPYKTHIGFSFPVEGTSKEKWCGCYVGFEPKGAGDIEVFVGGGVHQPMPDQLKALRKKIAGDHKTLAKLLAEKNFKKEFPSGLKGESLKRMPIGYEESHAAADWLRMKEFMFSSSLTKSELFSEELPTLLARKFNAAVPVALWFAEA